MFTEHLTNSFNAIWPLQIPLLRPLASQLCPAGASSNYSHFGCIYTIALISFSQHATTPEQPGAAPAPRP